MTSPKKHRKQTRNAQDRKQNKELHRGDRRRLAQRGKS